MTRRAALAVLTMVLGTAGCANAGDADEGRTEADSRLVAASGEAPAAFVRPGDCFGGQRFGDEAAAALAAENGYQDGAAQLADDPLWSDTVACNEPHAIEVYATVQLPPDLDRSVASYQDVLDTSTPLYRAVRDNVVHQCARANPMLASVADDTHLDLDVLPMIGSETVGRRAWDPVPPAVWAAGDRTFICTFQQPSSTNIDYDDILTGGFPIEGRSCLSGELFVSCDEAHDTERVALFIVDRSIDSGLLSGKDAVSADGVVDLGAAEWTLLDDACQRYVNAIAPNAPNGVFGVTDTYPELYPNEYGAFNIMCLARSPFGTSAADMVTTRSSVYEG